MAKARNSPYDDHTGHERNPDVSSISFRATAPGYLMTMNNVWKGLVVGGLTGVAAGLVLDSVTNTSEKARVLWKEADLPERLRDAAQKVKESDVARQVTKS